MGWVLALLGFQVPGKEKEEATGSQTTHNHSETPPSHSNLAQAGQEKYGTQQTLRMSHIPPPGLAGPSGSSTCPLSGQASSHGVNPNLGPMHLVQVQS